MVHRFCGCEPVPEWFDQVVPDGQDSQEAWIARDLIFDGIQRQGVPDPYHRHQCRPGGKLDRVEIRVDDGFSGPGYAVPSEEGADAVNLCYAVTSTYSTALLGFGIGRPSSFMPSR